MGSCSFSQESYRSKPLFLALIQGKYLHSYHEATTTLLSRTYLLSLVVLSCLVYWCNLLKQLGRNVVGWLPAYTSLPVKNTDFRSTLIIPFFLPCKFVKTVMTYWWTVATSCILTSLSCKMKFIKMDLNLSQSIKKLYSILICGQALFLQTSWEIACVNALVPHGPEKRQCCEFQWAAILVRKHWVNAYSHTQWPGKSSCKGSMIECTGERNTPFFNLQGPQNFDIL